jgi:hypothetical protein
MYKVQLETVMKHADDKYIWFHPRAAAIPGKSGTGPEVVLTIQKHLMISDYYSGLHTLHRASLSAPWTGPVLPPELDWRQQPDGITISVADVTSGWHALTGRLIAIGCQVRYNTAGAQLNDVKRAHQTVYAVYEPKSGQWSSWQVLELPPDEIFDFARNACAQWVVRGDGKLLVPLYISKGMVTVAECSFDGKTLVYLRHGSLLQLPVVPGLSARALALVEPSLIEFRGRYFLTLRNDYRGYVAAGDDGVSFGAVQPWLFDDGTELGSYNTQQHWLAHSDALYLVYTRRGANNDHIMRHRAPLFMAQVNPDTLQVIRSTERVVVPERGAELGNFGACAISESESWVTVSEGMFMKDSRERGAEGATFVARVIWDKPNKLAAPLVVNG